MSRPGLQILRVEERDEIGRLCTPAESDILFIDIVDGGLMTGTQVGNLEELLELAIFHASRYDESVMALRAELKSRGRLPILSVVSDNLLVHPSQCSFWEERDAEQTAFDFTHGDLAELKDMRITLCEG